MRFSDAITEASRAAKPLVSIVGIRLCRDALSSNAVLSARMLATVV